jgi:hypothetical protein
MRESSLAKWTADGLYWIFFALSLLCFFFVPFLYVSCGIFHCSELEWSLPFGILGMASLFFVTVSILIRRLLTGNFQNPYKGVSIILFWLVMAGAVVLGAVMRDQPSNTEPVTSSSAINLLRIV